MVRGQSSYRRCPLHYLFHQFTLTFDDKKREKFVEWFGYSASVSPYILEQFENGQATNSARSTLWIRDITTACSAFPANSSWIS